MESSVVQGDRYESSLQFSNFPISYQEQEDITSASILESVLNLNSGEIPILATEINEFCEEITADDILESILNGPDLFPLNNVTSQQQNHVSEVGVSQEKDNYNPPTPTATTAEETNGIAVNLITDKDTKKVKEKVLKKVKLRKGKNPDKDVANNRRNHDFACRHCEKSFSIKWNLVTHERIHTGEKPFPCPGCSQQFRQFAHLQKHMRSCHPEREPPNRQSFSCRSDVKNQPFVVKTSPKPTSPPATKPSQVKEARICTRKKRFHCSVCPYKCGQFTHLQKHMSARHPEREPLERQNFRSTGYLRNVKKSVARARKRLPVQIAEDSNKKYNLRECQVKVGRYDLNSKKPMSSTFLLQKLNNMVANSNGKNIKLEVPGEGQNYIVEMNADLLSHFLQPTLPQTPPMVSSTSGYSSSSSISLSPFVQWQHHHDLNGSFSSPTEKIAKPKNKRGMKAKVSENVQPKPKVENCFKCGKCKKSFAMKASLSVHNLRHHSNVVQPFPRQGKISSSLEAQFENKCSDSVQTEVGSANSMISKKPGGSSMFECSVCQRRFSRLDQLKLHIQLHNGTEENKKLECHVCKKCFARPHYLAIHYRIHTGEKPFECNLCGKKFRQKSPLNTHMRIHTNEKPFQCNICEKTFRQKMSLVAHKKRNHPEATILECKICRVPFSDNYSLNTHIETSH